MSFFFFFNVEQLVVYFLDFGLDLALFVAGKMQEIISQKYRIHLSFKERRGRRRKKKFMILVPLLLENEREWSEGAHVVILEIFSVMTCTGSSLLDGQW